jgi:hypothetical protein
VLERDRRPRLAGRRTDSLRISVKQINYLALGQGFGEGQVPPPVPSAPLPGRSPLTGSLSALYLGGNARELTSGRAPIAREGGSAEKGRSVKRVFMPSMRLGLAAETIALVCTALFASAAIYVSLVEHSARELRRGARRRGVPSEL